MPSIVRKALRRRSQSPLVRVLCAAGLALLFHGAVLTGLELTGAFSRLSPTALQLLNGDAQRQNEADEPVQIDAIVQEIDQPPQLTEAEKKQKEEEERKDQNGQVVDIAKPAVEMRPENARFLSEYDTKVTRETKGAVGKGQAGAPHEPSLPSPPSPPQQAQPPVPAGGPKSSALAMRGPLGTKLPGPSGETADVKTIGPDGELAHQAGAGPVKPPETPGGGALPNRGQQALPNLMPSRQMLERTLGQGSGSPDFLEEMEEADSTSLSSKKWKFAEFFNRLKRAVAQDWHPDELLEKHDPSGRIYGAVDRHTVLKVKLRPDGKIEDLEVARSSGLDILDGAAMSAFRQAQPFANPPAPLVEADGFIRFRFGFVVQMSGRTSFKFYKYKD